MKRWSVVSASPTVYVVSTPSVWRSSRSVGSWVMHCRSTTYSVHLKKKKKGLPTTVNISCAIIRIFSPLYLDVRLSLAGNYTMLYYNVQQVLSNLYPNLKCLCVIWNVVRFCEMLKRLFGNFAFWKMGFFWKCLFWNALFWASGPP